MLVKPTELALSGVIGGESESKSKVLESSHLQQRPVLVSETVQVEADGWNSHSACVMATENGYVA